MKIKIAEVLKKYDDYTCQNGAVLRSVWAKLDTGTSGKIVTFTDKIKVEPGVELEVGKQETKSYEKDGVKNTYIQYTIYAPKKDNFGGGYTKYSKPTYSQEEYDQLFDYAVKKIAKVIPDMTSENFQKLVSTYMIGAQNSGVKIDSIPGPSMAETDAGVDAKLGTDKTGQTMPGITDNSDEIPF